MAVDGGPRLAMAFFAELASNNTREFWTANKTRYEAEVREPFLDLLERLGGDGRSWHVFRPHRDIRFSRDKSPYKTSIGAYAQRPAGTGFYVGMEATGLIVATGYPTFANDQLDRYRTAVGDDATGAALVTIVEACRSGERQVGPGLSPPLKSAPCGIAKDHPRIELLRWKGVTCTHHFGTPDWREIANAATLVRAIWQDAEPINAWLEHYVGPSILPTNGRGRR